MSRGLAVGLAGAAIGSFIPGVGPLMGYAVGSAVGSALFGPKAPDQEGPRLKDLNVITSQEGAPIPKVYGSARLSGNVIWGKPLQEHKKKKKAGGGKGGGSPKVTTYTYTLDFAMGLCEGEIAGIVRMWDNGKLILDASPLTAAEQAIVSGGGYVPDAVARFSSFFNKTTELIGGGSMRVYPGSETQMPDPLIEADLGVGNTPAYRGLAYIVFDNYPTQQMPNITVEVVASGSSGIVYLGKQGPFDVLPSQLPPFDSEVAIFSHYVRPGKTIASASWYSTFASSDKRHIDPLTIYSSGISQYGQRHTAGGDQNDQNLMAFCDVPAYFSLNAGGADAQELFLHDVSGGNAQLIGKFRGVDVNDFGDLDDAASGAWYVDGEVWAYDDFDKRILSSVPQGAVLAATSSLTMTVRGVVTSLVSGTIRSVWIGVEEIYVVSGSANPYTLTVIDRDSFVTLRTATLPIAYFASGSNTVVRTYSPRTGQLYILYADNSAGTSQHLYFVDGATGLYLGAVPSTSIDVVNSRHLSVEDGILSVFHMQLANYTGTPLGPLGAIYYWSLNAVASNSVPLSTIVADICESAGLDSSLVNVTDLASTMVKGYIRNAQMTARAALEPLATGFFFDAVESGATLTFRHRGGPAVKTISADDLGTTMGDTPVDRAATTIVQDNELPIELDLQYIDPARDYQVGSQRSRRQIPASEKVSSVTMPIVWTGTEAKQAVEKLHYTAWEERNQYKLSLPIRYLALEPGDAITVPVNGFNRRLRITRTELGNTLECEAVSDFAASYVSEAVAASNPTGPQVIKVPGTTIAVLLDIPILADSDNDAGLYIAAMGTGLGWTGAEIFKSVDGVSYESVDSITSESTIGSMVDVLPAGSTTVWDDGPAVKVRLLEGTLESVTDLEAMAGANTAAIGVNGRWEIVSFANAVLNGDGTYSLSRRIRGRKGTEWAVGLHALSDTFVLLEAGDLIRNVPATSDIGAARHYKAVSFGASDGDVMPYTHQAVGLEPYAPAHISGNLAAGDWTISWVRRNRIDGEWRDYVDVPMSEASESYEVDIMDGSTVARTLAASTPTVTYTAAMMSADFGETKTTLDVNVYQLSATVGRGYAGAATLTAPAGATVALLHFDGADGSTTFTDATGKTWTAAGNARIDTAESKFGGASGLFDGAGDHISTPSSADFAYGTGDFTWELWVRLATTAGNQYILEHGSNGGTLVYNGGLKYYNTTTGTGSVLYTANPALVAGTWHHIAAARGAGTTRLFVDGVLKASAADSHNYPAQALRIGDYGGGGFGMDGRPDEFRIKRGAALYTANFTPPAAPFTE